MQTQMNLKKRITLMKIHMNKIKMILLVNRHKIKILWQIQFLIIFAAAMITTLVHKRTLI